MQLDAETGLQATATDEPTLPYPVVGIGGSAGGLEAVTTLLRELPANTGMAFVYVSHLSPDHPSHLAEILSRNTGMTVIQVNDEPVVERDHLYVIPPNRVMSLSGGHLRLRPRDDSGRDRPINEFFRSLATDQGRCAIGIVLSGTGDDGTVGLMEIKTAGGFAFAQDVASAAHDGMPASAVAAGCVDLVLRPEQIAQELVRMARHPYVADAEQGGEEADIGEILSLIRDETGVDFRAYKRSTLRRRITRRMVLQKLDTLPQYLGLLHDERAERERLFHDILINVTCFFRDPEGFEAIKTEILPKLTREGRNEPLRIWVLGCSTGEEAYSLAMICQEYATASARRLPVQIFATDLNAAVIEKARSGIYTRAIEDDVSPERLRLFFKQVENGYRIRQEIREMCVFARHNGLTDPPFSHMDLVACRNMLIYLDRSLQQRLLPTLHFALRPEGYLWLGSSEAIGTCHDLFDAERPQLKIYKKRGDSTRIPPAFREPSTPPLRERQYPRARPVAAPATLQLQREADRILLTRYAPAGVLVDSDLDILQFRGNTGAYLTPAPGKASLNLLKMLREGLLVAVRGALAQARRERTTVRQEGLVLTTELGTRDVGVEVIPVTIGEGEPRFLVLFEEANRPASPSSAQAQDPGGREVDYERLAQELAATREYLQSVIEQHESVIEQLQTAHEEVQSSNEELQSINEELETSKEEIQSSNEELSTLNEELHARNAELSRSNNDMFNLLASVRMPIVMLGSDLRIRRFTPMAEKLLNLREADIGRSVVDINLNIGVEEIDQVIADVIDSAVVRELDVKDRHGRWYSMRVWPYRTLENRIEGAVLLLVDIDVLKRARAYSEGIVAAVAEPLVVLDSDLRVRKASHVFYEAFDLKPSAVELVPFVEIWGGRWNTPELLRALDTVRYLDERLRAFEFTVAIDGDRRTMLMNAQRLAQEDGSVSIILTISDVSELKRLEESLRSRVEQLAQTNRRQNEFLAMLAHELRNPLAALRSGSEVLLLAPDDSETTARTHAMIDRQVTHMARMIDDLLDVSRISSGRIQLRLEPLDLSVLVRRCCDAMRPMLQGHGVELTVDVPDGPMPVDADPLRLEQVLSNLLSNASKFTPDGGHVRVGLARGEGTQQSVVALLTVRDDGIGLSAEMLPRVFDAFVQAQRSTGSSGGLGIGLTLVRRLVELHGGNISVKSDGLSKGSTFEVCLPMRRDDADLPARPGVRSEAEKAESARRVLIVEDNVDAAESLAILLRLAGHEVRTAQDGETALELAGAFGPDAVLLDIGLPGMNGYEVARRLRSLPRHERAVLIALTGYGQDQDRRRSAEAGFGVHLMKPVDLAQVEAVLERLSRRAKPPP